MALEAVAVFAPRLVNVSKTLPTAPAMESTDEATTAATLGTLVSFLDPGGHGQLDALFSLSTTEGLRTLLRGHRSIDRTLRSRGGWP